MKKHYVILDDLPDSFIYSEEMLCISREPVASYKLARKGIPYKIIEDFYEEEFFWVRDSGYFQEQIRWFRQMDDAFLATFHPDAQSIFMPNYLRFKYVVDTMFIFDRVLFKLLADVPEGGSLSYVFSDPPTSMGLFDFALTNQYLFKTMLEVSCAEKNIPLILKEFRSDRTRRPSKNSYEQQSLLRSVVKNFKAFGGLEKWRFPKRHTPIAAALFLHTGSLDVDVPLRHFLKTTCSVYVWEKGCVYLESSMSRRKVFELKKDLTSSFYSKGLEPVLERFLSLDLVGFWHRRWFKAAVVEVWKDFLRKIIPSEIFFLFDAAEQLRPFLSSASIDFVFFRGNSEPDAAGLLYAIQKGSSVKRVCFQHSNFGLQKRIFSVFETNTYDYIVTRDDLSCEFFQAERTASFPHNAKLLQSGHYLTSFSRRAPRSPFAKVIYLEGRFPSHVRAIDNESYSLTWYYELQKKIINYMGQKKNLQFIFKHAPMPYQKISILDYIRDQKYENIEVLSCSFRQAAEQAGRVFMDYFSSAFYESLFMKIPTLCLNYGIFPWLANMKKHFGDCLQDFNDFDEAISRLDYFLSDSNGDRYIKDIPIQEPCFESALGVLESDIAKARSNHP